MLATDVAADAAADILRLDTTDEADWISVMAAARAAHGRIDILVSNAGISATLQSPIRDTALADWRRIMSVNLDGVFMGIKHAFPMMAARGGSIVNIASIRLCFTYREGFPVRHHGVGLGA